MGGSKFFEKLTPKHAHPEPDTSPPPPYEENQINTSSDTQLRSLGPTLIPKKLTKWLGVNIIIASITAWLFWILASAIIAFAMVIRSDLENQPDDYNCEANYIRDASLPAGYTKHQWVDSEAPGRYHSQCQLLVVDAYVLIVAGSISLVRAFMQFIPVYVPTAFTIRYPTDSFFESITSPARVYAVRSFLSMLAVPCYLVGAIILASNRLITGPPAEDSYRNGYLACLGLILLATLLSIHQWMVTSYAGWLVRGWKRRQ